MSTPGVTRRGLLAAGSTGAAAATAGCFSRLRSRITYDPADQVELSLKTVPADDDPASIRIAQELRRHLEAVGVDVSLELLGREQLLRDVLINHEFDLFVAEVPGHEEPDELRAYLHSRFAGEEGWQNPFGFASRRIDRSLEAQRRPDVVDRREHVERMQRDVVRDHPFVVLASLPHVTAASPDLQVPGELGFASPLSYLLVERVDGEGESDGNGTGDGDGAGDGDGDDTGGDGDATDGDGETTDGDGGQDGGDDVEELTVALRRESPTQNHNVLSVAYRTHDRLTDLLYDPLVRRIGDEHVPWLAEWWSVDERDNTASARLREGVTWHDGEPVTAEDVAFTYRFLRDTALDGLETAVPAPRFRHRTSLVNGVEVVDDRTVSLQVDPAPPELRPAVFDVPVLPEAQWRERSAVEHDYLTAAIVGNVENPIGSGPLQFESVTPEQSLTFSRFDDHFLRTAEDLPPALEPFAGGPPYERLVATASPNLGTAVDGVANGDTDLVDGGLTVEATAEAEDREGVALVEARTPTYYCLGFNARRHPLSNYAFRSALASLLDREFLVEEVFDGRASPVESPLFATEWVPEDLRWTGQSVAAPFAGRDGELDPELARAGFRDAGFRYHEGELRSRQ